jgi:hypothetical protein
MNNILTRLQLRLSQLNPELFALLQEERRVTDYLNSFLLVPGDPEEALCDVITPTRYDYLSSVLEEEFEEAYLRFSGSGILTYELINLSAVCTDVFEHFGFPENEDSRMLRYAVIGTVAEYLEGGIEDEF